MSTISIDVDLDEFSDDDIVDAALDIIKSYEAVDKAQIHEQIFGHEPTNADAILAAFNPLNSHDLERALQAIRDRSHHDLQMILS